MRRPPSSFAIVALLLHLSLSGLTDARVLNSQGLANNDAPLYEMLDDVGELTDEETSVGSFSQLPLQQQQQQPPLLPPAPPCAEPPFTLPSPTSNQFSPPLPGIPTQGTPTPTSPHSQPGPVPQIPSPPYSLPGPPTQIPSPPTQFLSPPVSQPGPPPTQFPIPPVRTPPSVPVVTSVPPPPPSPPSQKKPGSGTWCVAKPSVSDSILQRALDYACGTGGDCKLIQPGGPCYQPNTMSAHSSFAFNSYWQKSKAAGGTCDFGGTAMLVSIDPSYNDCRFVCT